MYSPENLYKLIVALKSVQKERNNLLLAAGRLKLSNAEADRFLFQGAMRRAKLVAFGVHTVFDAIPPELATVPNEEQNARATLAIHSHFINVFGFFDCMAWVWFHEFDVSDPEGNALSRTKVTFFGKNSKHLRKQLPEALVAYLDQLKGWMSYLEEHRHALAHRVPPYIPPHFVDPENEVQYAKLEQDWFKTLDPELQKKIEIDQAGLKHFKPFALFDLAKAPPFVFHAQMIADFRTVIEFGHNFLKAMETKQASI